jgi:hypothetical protein
MISKIELLSRLWDIEKMISQLTKDVDAYNVESKAPEIDLDLPF